jgi:hypothetical protein
MVISRRKKRSAEVLPVVLMLGGLVIAGGAVFGLQIGRKRPETVDKIEIGMTLHGRVLNVVVEDDGIYIGDEYVPFLLFRDFLIGNAKRLSPDSVIVYGTTTARFGQVVGALDACRAELKIYCTMGTRTIPANTRLKSVESSRNFFLPL